MADFSSLEMLPVASALAFAGDLTLKIFALILLAAIAALLLRKSTAATRHMVWLSALVATLLLPAASYFMPAKLTTYWKAPAFSRAIPAPTEVEFRDGTRRSTTYAPTVGSAMNSTANLTASHSTLAAQSAASRPFRWVALIVGVYAMGTFAILLQISLGIVGVARLSRTSTAVTTNSAAASILADLRQQLGIRREISLRLHEDATPMTWGWRRPIILLPPDGESWGIERLRVVLLHELAHIARSDWPTQMLAHLICAAHWPNPLIWWAAARMRAESERACDDRVLLAGIAPDAYARHLLEIARGRLGDVGSVGVRFVTPMADSKGLEQRLRRVLGAGVRRTGMVKREISVTLGGACIVVLLMSLVRPSIGQSAHVVAKRSATATQMRDAHRAERNIPPRRHRSSGGGSVKLTRSALPHRIAPLASSSVAGAEKKRAVEHAVQNIRTLTPRSPQPPKGLVPRNDELPPDYAEDMKALAITNAEDISVHATTWGTSAISDVNQLTLVTAHLANRSDGFGAIQGDSFGGKSPWRVRHVGAVPGLWLIDDTYAVSQGRSGESHHSEIVEADGTPSGAKVAIAYGPWTHGTRNGVPGYGMTLTLTHTQCLHKVVIRGRKEVGYEDIEFGPSCFVDSKSAPPMAMRIWIDERTLPFADLRSVRVYFQPRNPMFIHITTTVSDRSRPSGT